MAVLAGCSQSNAVDKIEFENRVEGIVTQVVDGDTWYMDTEEERVRAWGYDTPECNRNTTCPTADHTIKVTELIMGEHLTCEWVGRRRSFDRKVVRCYLDDGTDIGKVMIDAGVAVEDCDFSKNFWGNCPD